MSLILARLKTHQEKQIPVSNTDSGSVEYLVIKIDGLFYYNYNFHLWINQILKKNKELKMAAELGKKMLEENDDLRGMYNELEQEHENTVKVSWLL